MNDDHPAAPLDAAERLLHDVGPGFAWTRAATHLTRQALEDGLRRLWTARGQLGLTASNQRTQLICLPFFLDADLAARVAWTWQAASQAGHHHGYEMAPPADDVLTWISTVRELLAAVESR